MTKVEIQEGDDLRRVAFKVCTRLAEAGARAILTGGSAATIYAPEVYQSRDTDFVIYALRSASEFWDAVQSMGFKRKGTTYAHELVPITLDFVDEEIRVGAELIERYETVEEGGLQLHLLTPTDCVRDRLASFYWFSDRTALVAACGVTRACADRVSLEEIREWSEREAEKEKFAQFIERLQRP